MIQQKIHDKNRKYVNGRTSYNDIINNLLNIRNSKERVFTKVVLYNNLSKNSIRYLKKYKKEAFRLFNKDIRFKFSLFAIKNFNENKEIDYVLSVKQIAKFYQFL